MLSLNGWLLNDLSEMKKITDKKRRILRNIFKGLTLTSAAFVFQACYGTPEDFGLDVRIHGVVVSRTTNEPIPGIKVSVENYPQYKLTDSKGSFLIYASQEKILYVKFEDIDSTQNGVYLSQEITIEFIDRDIKDVTLNVSMDAAQ
jgi:putative lipoprotein (rSAM/lipoprotein system)